MKRVRNTLFNRTFRKKELKEWQTYKKECQQIIGWYPQLCQDLKEAKTLENLIAIHKHAWQLGYQHVNLAPCEWGMFRTKDIMKMQPSEVYLGNIWGLLTKNIPFWNEHRNETMSGNGFGIDDTKKIYDLIMSQYCQHLKSNFRMIQQERCQDLLGHE